MQKNGFKRSTTLGMKINASVSKNNPSIESKNNAYGKSQKNYHQSTSLQSIRDGSPKKDKKKIGLKRRKISEFELKSRSSISFKSNMDYVLENTQKIQSCQEFEDEMKHATESEGSSSLKASSRSLNKRDSVISAFSLTSHDPRYTKRALTYQNIVLKKKKFGCNLVINPKNKIKMIWDTYILALILISTTVIPFKMGFLNDDESSFAWEMIDFIIDISFIIDIILQFFTAFIDLNDNLVTSKKKIFLNYLLGWLVVDLISAIPFSLIRLFLNQNSSYGNLLKISRFPKVIGLGRLLRVSRLLKIVKNRRGIFKMIKISSSIGAVVTRLYMTLLLCLIICHVASCVWSISAVYNGSDPDNWYLRLGFQDKTIFEKYLASFYWVIQTVFSVGYGDFPAKTVYEQIVACIWMFCGVFVYSFFIGSFTSLFANLDRSRQKIKQMLNTLQKIRKEFFISDDMYKKTRNIIKIGSESKSENYEEFLKELPYDIQIDLSYQIYSQDLKDVDYFSDKTKTFIAIIGAMLKPLHIPKGEYVYTKDDAAEEIFFIKKGSVCACLPEYSNYEFLEIKQGYYFGEIELLHNEDKRLYTFMAKENCELLLLNKKKFVQIFLMRFRDVGENLLRNALVRELNFKEAYESALEICLNNKKKNLRRTNSKTTFYKGNISEDDVYQALEKFEEKPQKTFPEIIPNSVENNNMSGIFSSATELDLKSNASQLNLPNKIAHKINFLEELKKGISTNAQKEKENATIEKMLSKIESLSRIVDGICKFLACHQCTTQFSKQDAECQTDEYFPVQQNNSITFLDNLPNNKNDDTIQYLGEDENTHDDLNKNSLTNDGNPLSSQEVVKDSLSLTQKNESIINEDFNSKNNLIPNEKNSDNQPFRNFFKSKSLFDGNPTESKISQEINLISPGIKKLGSKNTKEVFSPVFHFNKNKAIQSTLVESKQLNSMNSNRFSQKRRATTSILNIDLNSISDEAEKEKIIENLYEDIIKVKNLN